MSSRLLPSSCRLVRTRGGVLVGVFAALTVAEAPPTFGQCELQKAVASDAADNDQFGHSISLSGDHIVVGARYDDDAGPASGSAYVFGRNRNGTPSDPGDDVWIEQSKLTAHDAAAYDLFGISVAIEGKLCVVGATAGPAAAFGPGSVYVYRRDDRGTPTDASDDVWLQESQLLPSDGLDGDQFGVSVAVQDDRVAVGSYGDGGGGIYSGAVYVFRRDDGGTPSAPDDDFWIEEDKLTAPDSALGDAFGSSVSLDADRIATGAWSDDVVGSASGSVYVFLRQGTSWTAEAKIFPSDAADNDLFGKSVSLSGDRLVAGAWADDDGGTSSGSAYVFRRDDQGTPADPGDDVWIEEDKLTASDSMSPGYFGLSVSMRGNQALIGANYSGAAYLFQRDDNGTPSEPSDDTWFEKAKLTAADTTRNNFGYSVSIGGQEAVVGALDDDEVGRSAGAAYVFAVDGPDCNDNTQLDICDIMIGTSDDVDGNGVADECEDVATFDIKPGACPNPVNPRSHGLVPMALAGMETFEVAEVDLDSVTLRRADGTDDAVAPALRGNHLMVHIEDVTAPHEGDACECQETPPDGLIDLVLHFSAEAMADTFGLDQLRPGEQVELALTGELLDGTPFRATDCLTIPGRRSEPSHERGVRYRAGR